MNEYIWPLVVLLIALVALHLFNRDVRPIFQGMTSSLRVQSGKYAVLWAMALLYAAGASFQALADVATQFGWVYVAAFAKVVQPGVVAIIAFINKAPSNSEPKP